MTRRPRVSAYHRAMIGGGNALRAVSRAKRSAASRRVGKAPGKQPGPAVWRIHERRALDAAMKEMAEQDKDMPAELDLPGMWETADFEGGLEEVRGAA